MRWLLLKKVLKKKASAAEKGRALSDCARLERVEGRRYIHRGLYSAADQSNFEYLLHGDDGASFRANFRTSRGAFHELARLISGHGAFQPPPGSRKVQAPVECQLMVFLYYIGTKGTTTQQMKSMFRCAYGTVWNYIWRVCAAFESLSASTISWPGRAEKASNS